MLERLLLERGFRLRQRHDGAAGPFGRGDLGAADRQDAFKVLAGQAAGIAEDQRALQDIAQLPHIARPVVARQRRQRRRRDPRVDVVAGCLDVIKQARRYKSRRELTQALRLIARADMALRSNPPSKRMVLENLVLALARPAQPETPAWAQEELPVL